jgi:hypothetical protein
LSVNNEYENFEEMYAGLAELVNLGKERGYLQHDEVINALPDDIDASKDLDSVVYLLGDAGIEITDSRQLEIGRRPRSKIKEDERPDPVAAKLEKTNDPARLYLREMGTVSLLTREEEVEIAKRIEEGQRKVIQALSFSSIVVAQILKYREKLKKNELHIRNLVDFDTDELTEEILGTRRRKVLRRINAAEPLQEGQQELQKATLPIGLLSHSDSPDHPGSAVDCPNSSGTGQHHQEHHGSNPGSGLGVEKTQETAEIPAQAGRGQEGEVACSRNCQGNEAD